MAGGYCPWGVDASRKVAPVFQPARSRQECSAGLQTGPVPTGMSALRCSAGLQTGDGGRSPTGMSALRRGQADVISVCKRAVRRGLGHCPLWVRWGVCGFYLGIVAVLSLVPPSVLPPLPAIPGMDKLAHFLMYGGLGACLYWALSGSRWRAPRVFVVLAGAFTYGLLMEILQSACTEGMRVFGWGDLTANVLGTIVFWQAAKGFHRWLLCGGVTEGKEGNEGEGLPQPVMIPEDTPSRGDVRLP